MKDNKELAIVVNDKQEIKLSQGRNRSIDSSSGLELSITKCPISCNNCKTIYSNKITAIRIVCRCSCHSTVDHEVT